MAFKTKNERYAYVKGVKKGFYQASRKKPRQEKPPAASSFDVDDFFAAALKRTYGKGYTPPRSGKGRKDDFHRDSRGRIKGAYVDGRFEPD